MAAKVALPGQTYLPASKPRRITNRGDLLMPIVTIHALLPAERQQIGTMLTEVARSLASALNTPPSNVWVHFEPIVAFCEGEAVPSQSDYHPVVTVLANPRPEEAINRGLESIATAVADGLGLNRKHIWIHWTDLPHGRVYADGKIS
jgi:phenylpyruvate tautomerase PptA (4-oxalocrotonate tautomerase family)